MGGISIVKGMNPDRSLLNSEFAEEVDKYTMKYYSDCCNVEMSPNETICPECCEFCTAIPKPEEEDSLNRIQFEHDEED